MVRSFGRAIAAVTASPPNWLAWHDAGPVGELAERDGAQIRTHDGQLRITAASPEAYFDANEQHHPMSLAGRPLLERAGTYRDVRDAALAILCEGNQDPDAFIVSSSYRVIEVRPPMSAQHGTTNGTPGVPPMKIGEERARPDVGGGRDVGNRGGLIAALGISERRSSTEMTSRVEDTLE